jgi:hypothetical protein
MRPILRFITVPAILLFGLPVVSHVADALDVPVIGTVGTAEAAFVRSGEIKYQTVLGTRQVSSSVVVEDAPSGLETIEITVTDFSTETPEVITSVLVLVGHEEDTGDAIYEVDDLVLVDEASLNFTMEADLLDADGYLLATDALTLFAEGGPRTIVQFLEGGPIEIIQFLEGGPREIVQFDTAPEDASDETVFDLVEFRTVE